MQDLTYTPAPAAGTCPIWCKRTHKLDLADGPVLAHSSVVAEHVTADGTITIALVWEQRIDAALSEPPHIQVGCRFGVLTVWPEHADALVRALETAGAPAWLIEDVADAAAVIAPNRDGAL